MIHRIVESLSNSDFKHGGDERGGEDETFETVKRRYVVLWLFDFLLCLLSLECLLVWCERDDTHR